MNKFYSAFNNKTPAGNSGLHQLLGLRLLFCVRGE